MLRYQNEVTDEGWHVIGPHLPAINSTARPHAWAKREIINGILNVMRSGCLWALLPSVLLSWSTVYRWFAKLRDESRFEKTNHALVMLDCERIGRQSGPMGAIVDSQRVKTIEAGGPRGRERYALVETDGRGIVLKPHLASIQDCGSGGPLLGASRRVFPFIKRVFADSRYAGEKVTRATLIAVEIVRKNPNQINFVVNLRRWAVERFFTWILAPSVRQWCDMLPAYGVSLSKVAPVANYSQ
jgi:transposase